MKLVRPSLLLVLIPLLLAGFMRGFPHSQTFGLSAPALTSPPNGTLLTDFAPVLQWVNPSGTTQYQIQVAPATLDGPGLDLHRGVVESNLSIPPPPQWYGLLPDMTYTWRLRVSDAATYVSLDDPSWSPWSEKRTFRTPKVSSATIDVVNPLPDATTNTLHPILQWRDRDSNTWYYEVQVSKAPDFGPNAFRYHELRHAGVTAPARSYAIPTAFPLEDNTAYYWRVRPRSQGDAAPLAWSQTFSFRAAATAAPAWQDGRFWQYRLTYQDKVAKVTHLVLGKVTMEGEPVYLVFSTLSPEVGQPLNAKIVYFSAQDFRTLMELDAGLMTVGRALSFPMSVGQRFVWTFDSDGQARYARITASEQVQVQGATYDAFKVQPEDAPEGTVAWWYSPQVQFTVRQDAGGGASAEIEASGVLGREAGLGSAFDVLGAMATSTERSLRSSSVAPILEISRHFRRATGTELLKVLSQDQDAVVREKAAAALAALAGARTTAPLALNPTRAGAPEKRIHKSPVGEIVAWIGDEVAGYFLNAELDKLDIFPTSVKIRFPPTRKLPPLDVGHTMHMPFEVDYAVSLIEAARWLPFADFHHFVHILEADIDGTTIAREGRTSGAMKRDAWFADPAGFNMKYDLLPAILLRKWSCRGPNTAKLTIYAYTIEFFRGWTGESSWQLEDDLSEVTFQVKNPFYIDRAVIEPERHSHHANQWAQASVKIGREDPGVVSLPDNWGAYPLDNAHEGTIEVKVEGGGHHRATATAQMSVRFRPSPLFDETVAVETLHFELPGHHSPDPAGDRTTAENFTVTGKVSGVRKPDGKTDVPWEGELHLRDSNECSYTATASDVDAGAHDSPGIPGPTSTPTATPVPALIRVSITEPLNGAAFGSGAMIRFAGTATDAEGADLTANLTWVSSIDGIIGRGGSFSAVLSAGTHIITASVTDAGGRTGSAAIAVSVAPATSTPTPSPVPAISVPRVSITQPLNGTAFGSGETIRFAGTATDAEGADLTASLAWVSSIGGVIGRGGSFSAVLSAGTHIITASVTDAGGRTGSASIAISVAATAATPTPTPVLG